MSSQTEEIKNRIDIVELIGSYLRLQKAGANFKALCPFHHEKTPSFNVSPARQIWHCFGCGKGGDQFTFLQEIDGVEFAEALRALAERAGVELRPEDREERSERARLFLLLEEATKFFESQLAPLESGGRTAPGGPAAKADPFDYLKKRGMTDDTIKEFRLGYAPAEWKELFNYLLGKGFKPDEMERAGVVLKSSGYGGAQAGRQNYFDRFRGRIIFPISDYNGKIIAFGGRIFPEKENEAKYVNSPETLLYQKSKVVYGLEKAKPEILRAGECVLVEGYMDAIMSHQAGVKNAVAVSGTALTEDQLKILRRFSDKLIAAFDMDSAGEGAAKRGISLAMTQNFEVKAAVLDGFKDPAEAVAKDAQIWSSAVAGAKHIVDFYIDSVLRKHNASTPEAKREFQKSVLPVVLAISELEQAHWIKRIADILNVREDAVWEALKKIRNSKHDPPAGRAGIRNNSGDNFLEKPQSKTRKDLLEARTIGILAKFPALSAKLDPEIRGVLPQENRTAIFAELFIKEISEAEVELISCQRELKKEYLKGRMQALSLEIGRNEKSGSGEVGRLAEEFKKTAEDLSKLN